VSRTRRFLGGVAFGYANQALITLVGLWLTAFLLQRLGQDDYGLWLVGTRILGYLMLLDLGVVALLPREVAFATGRAGGVTEADDLPEIVGRTARLVFWQLPLVALAAAIIWFALPAEWEPLRDPLGIVMATFVVLFPLRVFQALLNGLQDLAFLGAVHTVSWILGTALTITLVVAGLGLYALAIGWGLTQLLSAILWFVRARRRYGHALRLRFPRFAPDQLRDRLTRSGWISISQVAQVFLSGTDLLIVGKIMGAAAVVPYFCTAKLIVVFANQPKMLAEAAQPALSELRTGAPRERVAQVCTALTRAILIFSGAIVCVVLVVNEGFVGWWVGAEQFGGFDLTVVLLAAMVLRHWYSAVVRALFAFGQDRRISLTTLFDGLLTVGAGHPGRFGARDERPGAPPGDGPLALAVALHSGGGSRRRRWAALDPRLRAHPRDRNTRRRGGLRRRDAAVRPARSAGTLRAPPTRGAAAAGAGLGGVGRCRSVRPAA
jgi:O-antigen/teichoic acid export membrane protein